MKAITFIVNPTNLDKISSLLKSYNIFSKVEALNKKSELKKSLLQDLIIIEADSFTDKEISDLIVKQENRLIVLSADATKFPSSFTNYKECFINSNFKIIELSSRISDLLEIQEQRNNFVPIKLDNFYKNIKLFCDIYLKFNETKYIKIAYEGDIMTPEFIQKYQKKNINSFFITLNDFHLHGNSIFSEKLLDSSLYKNKIEELSKKTEILHSILSSLGVSTYILKYVDESITEFEDMLKKSNSELFSLFEKSKGTFLYDHGYLTICFANIILKELDWKNEMIRSKIMMAAMFHDLGITDPKLAMSEALGKSEILHLQAASKEEILNHSEKIATILHQDALVPDDVVNICLNHHEGIEQGYPKSKSSASLSQLECLFIIAHATAIGLYKKAFNVKKLPLIVEEIVTVYNKGNFRPIITALQSAIETGEIGGN